MKVLFGGCTLMGCIAVASLMIQGATTSEAKDAVKPMVFAQAAGGSQKSEGVAAKKIASASHFRVNVKTLGAKGDGKTNDSAAFREAAIQLKQAGGGTLVIPKATYIVGEQIHKPGQYPYYQMQLIFEVRGLKNLTVEGNGATLRLAPGLRYGSFDKDTGDRFDPPSMPFTDKNYGVDAGAMLAVLGTGTVTIRDLELDGNVSTLKLGGAYADTGRQLAAYGLYFHNNDKVHVENVYTHHHGLDGIAVGYQGLKESDPATPVTLININSEYNARQGLSWVGGRGLRAIRCKFNHTGRALNNGKPLISAPASGLDIEAEWSICRDGYFEDCEMINNAGAAMVADSGDGGYSTFKNCTFWGTTTWSAWVRKPGLRFEDCNFYGSVVHSWPSPDPKLATSYLRCNFEDKPWKDGKVYRQNSEAYLVEIGNGEGASFEKCRFTANTCRSIWFEKTGEKPGTFTDCTFVHRKADLKDQSFQAVIRGANLAGCRFIEKFPANTTGRWFIAPGNTTVRGGKPTVVDGPRVKWQNWSSGQTGAVKSGLYN